MRPYVLLYLALLPRQPIRALVIAWWWFMKKRVRARGQFRAAVARLPKSYPLWLLLNQPEQRDGKAVAELEDQAGDLPTLAIHLHLSPGTPPRLVHAAIASVLEQSYSHWKAYITSPNGKAISIPRDPRIHTVSVGASTRMAAMAQLAGTVGTSHFIPLAQGHKLTPGALLAYARAITACPEADKCVFYADQDESDSRGNRRRPWLKPAWDEDLFMAQDYLSAACAIPVEAMAQAGSQQSCSDAVAVYALLARLLIGPAALQARRVPYVATTTPVDSWSLFHPERAELVRALATANSAGDVSPGPFGTLILNRPLPDRAPLVSIIIPTRDRLDLLCPCVDSILNDTEYPEIELIIADNGSVMQETLDFFEQCKRDERVKIVAWPHRYNYSAINNFAVSQSSGQYICLLNNDTKAIEPGWLRALMAQAVRPEVGAVGARLVYDDYSIQHAGVVVGMGNAAGHAHRGLPMGQPGYFAQALVTRSATAVTAACLVVERMKFDAVDGLDEQGLAIAYNDVDLCLKLRRAGWRNMYVAQALLFHFESKSRGRDFDPEHRERYQRELETLQKRWDTIGFQDPTHHPGLDIASEEYRLKM